MNDEELNKGCLLITEYPGRNTGMPVLRVDEELRQWGFSLEMVRSSWLEEDALRQIGCNSHFRRNGILWCSAVDKPVIQHKACWNATTGLSTAPLHDTIRLCEKMGRTPR